TADVIFVNGWDLEEGLASDIETIAADSDAVVVPISANVPPLAFGDHADEEHADEEHADEEHADEEHADEEHADEEHADEEHADEEHADEEHADEEHADEEHADEEHADEEHHHEGADPHVWFAVHNVETWAENTAVVLSALNPDQAETFTANAEAYTAVLESLEAELAAQIASIPESNRKMVTNHDAFAYFAEEYGFEVVGTVIPSRSTLSEPSAQDLAGLIETMRRENLCVIFTETTVSDRLAETVAGELGDCTAVEIVQLYTGALGEPGSGIDSYVAFMRTNVASIVGALGTP
ncbi:MAG: zinc ABC transporter substrate-binding protein, partial [Anaerolineales bacterium]|nr:zinc ABC transporter substrate-binding protein [Anaerolineales bacterium]